VQNLEGEAFDKESPWEIAKQTEGNVKMFIFSSLRVCNSFGILYNDGLRRFGVTLLGIIATELAVNARVTRNGVACIKTANFLL
jgi:hypothetical protein